MRTQIGTQIGIAENCCEQAWCLMLWSIVENDEFSCWRRRRICICIYSTPVGEEIPFTNLGAASRPGVSFYGSA
jgi:hypothetical protein